MFVAVKLLKMILAVGAVGRVLVKGATAVQLFLPAQLSRSTQLSRVHMQIRLLLLL